MLFKMSVKNIRRSFKDYTIYFFTLILGVAVFYVFYPQLGVKLCSMAGGGVQKSIWCF